MSKFNITKKVSLEEFGEEWKDCFLEFYLPSYREIKEFTNEETPDNKKLEKGIESLERLFKQGKGISEEGMVDIVKEDIKDLPVQIITKSFQAISGQLDPK